MSIPLLSVEEFYASVPPYGVIADRLEKGLVIPFLGAGVNFSRREPPAEWYKSAPFLPLGSELSFYLADKSQFPYTDDCDHRDLAKVAAFYQDSSGRQPLCDELHEVFASPCPTCSIHDCLAEIPQLRLIITANYDELIEQAFKSAKRPYHLVIYPTDSERFGERILHWKYDPQSPCAAFEPELVPPGDLVDCRISF